MKQILSIAGRTKLGGAQWAAYLSMLLAFISVSIPITKAQNPFCGAVPATLQASCATNNEQHIVSVTINGVTNTTGCSSSTGINDFTTSGPTFTVCAGSVMDITLDLENSTIVGTTQHYGVWIDLNNDNDVTDAGEFFGGTLTSFTGGTITISVPIAANAPNGNRRMRIRTTAGTSTLAQGNSCTDFSAVAGAVNRPGETEDYTVSIVNPTAPVISSNTPVCTGGTLTLTATGSISGANYTWSGPNGYSQAFVGTGANVVFNVPSFSVGGVGDYSLTLTQSGCSVTSTTAVALGTQPTAPPIASTTPLCAGATLSLTATNTNGAIELYTWSGPNGYSTTFLGNFSSVTTTIPNVTTANAGVYSLSYTRNGCTSAVSTTLITINPAPNATLTSSSPACVGGTLVLIASPVAGATYTFTGPDGTNYGPQASNILTRTGAQVTATTLAAGTWTVTVTASGCSATASTNVTVNAQPTAAISAPANACADTPTQIVFAGSASSSATYAWSFGVNSTPSGTVGVGPHTVQWSATGGKTVQVTVSEPGCPAVTTNVTVTVRAPIAAPVVLATSPITVCPNGNFTIPIQNTNGGAVATTLEISGPNGFAFSTAIANGGTFNFTQANLPAAISELNEGTYTAFLNRTQAPGCSSPSVTFTILVEDMPTISLSNTGPVCEGASLQVIATPVLTGYDYTFVDPVGNAYGPQASNIHTVAAASLANDNGIWEVTITSVNGCVSNPAQTLATINTAPTAVATNGGAVCEGGAIQLFAETVTGASYAWVGPNGFTSSEQNPTRSNVTVADAGDYSLTVTLNGCVSAQVFTTVAVNAAVGFTPGAVSPICVGDQLSVTMQPVPVTATIPTGTIYTLLSTAGAVLDGPQTDNPTLVSIFNAGAFGDLFTGTYSVVVELPGCAAITIPVNFTVLESPTATFTALSPSVCVGQSANIQYTGNAEPGATYTWNCDGCNETLSGPGPHTATWSTPGTKVISLSVVNPDVTFNGTQCAAGVSSQQVVVNAIPVPAVTNNSPLCAGATLQLNETVGGFAQYNWTGPNGFSSANQSPMITNVTAANAGTYTLVVTDATGCSSLPVSTEVTVNTPFTALLLNNGPVCEGTGLNLVAIPAGATSYDFTSPTGAVFNSATNVLTIGAATLADAGVWTVQITDANGCVSNDGSTTVVVNAQPLASISAPTPVCANTATAINFTGTTSATATYTWNFGANAVPAATSGIGPHNVEWTAAGTKNVQVTVSEPGCNTVTATVNVVVRAPIAAPVVLATSPITVCPSGNFTIPIQNPNGTALATLLSITGPNGFSITGIDVTGAGTTFNFTQASIPGGVSELSEGVYTATLNRTQAPGCSSPSTTFTIVVEDLPTLSLSSTSPVCEGSDLQLIATPILPGYQYDFTDPAGNSTGLLATNTFTQVGATATTHAGQWTVTATSLNGCVSNPAQTLVAINAAPTAVATNGGAVCEGATIQLFAETVTGASYAWVGPNGFTSSTQNPTRSNVTVADAGDYSLTVTLNGCVSTQVFTTVTVNTGSVLNLAVQSPVCAGEAVQLDVTPAGSSTIVPGTTFTYYSPSGTILVGPQADLTSWNPGLAGEAGLDAGTYSVIVEVPGCSAYTLTANLAILPTPVANFTALPASICVGQSVALNFTGSAESAATYTWNCDGCNEILNGAGPHQITWSTVGTKNVTLDITNASFSATGTQCVATQFTQQVVVNAVPVPAVTNNSPLCAGATLQLNETVGGFAQYNWTGPNGFSSANQNPTITNVTAANAGTYTLVVTDVTGCSSLPISTEVTVHTPLTALLLNSGPVCENATLNLVALPAGAASYDFTSPTGAVFNSATNVFTIGAATLADAGVWIVTVTDVNGCVSNQANSTVVVNSIPTAVATNGGAVCEGGTIQLFAETVTGASYAWVGPNGFASSTQNPTRSNVTVADAGDYSLTVTLNGCVSTQVFTTVTVNAGSVLNLAVQSPVCAGEAVQLDVTPAGSSTIVPGTTFTYYSPSGAILVGPQADLTSWNPGLAGEAGLDAGTYSVIVEVPGCSAYTLTANLAILPTPVASFTALPPAACVGQVVTLNFTGSAESAATYTWNCDGCNETLNGAGPHQITWSAGGLKTITLDITNASFSVTGSQCVATQFSQVVNVTDLPAQPTLISNATICAGSDLLLTAQATVLGASYTLTGPNNYSVAFTGDGNDITQTITAANSTNAGNYYLSVSVNGCGSASTQLQVNIDNAPVGVTLSNNGPVCEGTPLTLTATQVEGASYTFTSPTFVSTTISANTLSIFAADLVDNGDWTVSVTSPNGCSSGLITSHVVVNDAPTQPVLTANGVFFCEGDAVFNPLTLDPGFTDVGALYTITGPNNYNVTFIGDGSGFQQQFISNPTVINAGSYFLTASLNGCTATSTSLKIDIFPNPPVGITPSATTVCAGETVIFTQNDPQNSNLSYTFFDGVFNVFGGYGPYITSYPNNTTQQTYTASYFVFDNQTGCFDFVIIPIIVNPQPANPTIISNTPICSGATLNLTVTATSANASYMVTGPNGYSNSFIGTGGNVTLSIANASVANAGAYTVSVVQNGCESPSTSTTVVVNQTPTAFFTATPATVCAAQPVTVTYTGTPVVGATYNWTFTNGTPNTATTLGPHTVTYATAGVQTLQLTATNGLCSASFSQTVTVTALPTTPTLSAVASICEGNTLTISTVAAAIPGATYNWSGPGGFTSTTIGVNTISRTNATVAMSGLYSLTITQNGCTSGLATTNATVNPTPVATLTTNSPICQGQTLLLTGTSSIAAPSTLLFEIAPPASAFIPFNVTSGNSIALTLGGATPASTGSWLLRVTRAGCTSAVVQVPVVVNPTPTVTASNSGPICPGQSAQLFASNATGATYAWSGPGGYTSTQQNPIISSVTTANQGPYSVTITVNGCTSTAVVTTTIGLNPTLAAPSLNQASPVNVCAGNTITLSVVPVGGVTYNWTGPNGFVGTGSSISIFNATTEHAGQYFVTASGSGVCTSTPSVVQVVVNPVPVVTLTNNGPVCVGTPLTLTATSLPGASYSFTSPTAVTFGPQTSNVVNLPSAAATHAGTWSVTATVNGCVSGVSTSTVTVNTTPSAPTPVSGAQTVCLGGTLNLTSSTVANATYQWLGPNGYTSNQQNPVRTNMTLADAGVYSVRVTVNGCTSAFATVNVTVTNLLTVTLSSNAPVCSGTALTLTATAGAASYTFTSPTGVITTQAGNTLTIAVSNASHNGTWTVTATSAGCVSNPATANVVVNTTPAVPTPNSNSAICAGQTLLLLGPSVQGATYAWSGPGGFTSAVQNPVRTNATVAMSGIYSLTVNVNGCATQGTHTVTVNAIPAPPAAFTFAPTVCVGDAIDLVAGPGLTPGATYSWTGPNDYAQTFVASGAGPFVFSIFNVTLASGGIYSLTATTNGCTSLPTLVQVSVSETPSSQFTPSAYTVCGGETVVFTVNEPNPNNFYFFDDGSGNFFSGTGPYVVTFPNAGVPQIYSTFLDAFDPTFTCASTTIIPITVNPTPAAPVVTSNSPVCTGNTLNLTVNSTISGAQYMVTGPAGYSFMFNGTGANVTIPIANTTLANAGAYTVSLVNNGCESTPTSVSVTINQTPSSFFTATPATICAGQPVTITYTGTPTPGATYSWFFINGTPNTATTLGPHTVTWNTTGTQTVQLVTINGACNSFFNQTVTVNTQPAQPTLNAVAPVCQGNTITLATAAASIAGATYNWSGPGGYTQTTVGVNTVSRTNATPAMSGTYTLTITQGGCTSAPAFVNVVVNATPTLAGISASTPVCVGSTINLTAPLISGATYNWTGPNGFTSALQNPSIANATVANAGTYSLTVTVNGCVSSPAATATVAVNSLAAVTAGSNSPVCVGGTLNLTANPAGASYDWAGPGGFVSSAQNPTLANVTTLNSGIYSVRVTVPGCGTQTVSFNVSISVPPPANVANNSPICAGSNLFLSSTFIPGANYSWTGPNGFSSTLVNPSIPAATTAASGLYILQISGAGICSTITLATNVIVDAPLTPPVITTNAPLCEGATLDLSVPVIAGAFYSWSGPAGFTSSSAAPSISNVTTANSGTYNVNVGILGSACPATNATANVVISATPVAGPLTSNSPVCVGATLSLTSPFVAGASYAWTGPDGFTSSVQSPIILTADLVNTGTYSLSITVNGCTSAPATVSGIVTPAPSATADSNTPLCTGQDLQLTATNTVVGVTYQWTGPNGYASGPFAGTGSDIVFTLANAVPSSSGFYILTATSACGTASTTINVVINAAPVVTASNNGPLCPGSTLELNSTFVAGATYAWTGPNFFTSAVQNPIRPLVSLSDDGIYQVVVTAPGCPPVSASTSVTIFQGATIAANNSGPVCTGGSVSLNATFIAGATYFWAGPAGFNSVSVNPVINNVDATNAGAYTVTVAVPGCPAPVSATTNVVVNPVPVASATSNSPVCTGGTLFLTAPFVAGATYNWVGPNGFVASAQNPALPNVDVANAGVYQVTISPGPGCTPATGSVSVNITPPTAMAAGNTGPVCVGGSINLTATTIAGATYHWTGPNGFTSNVQNPSLTNVGTAQAGIYSVSATTGSCAASGATTTVVVNPIPAPPSIATNIFICSGQTLNLTASLVSGASYNWSGPSGFVSTSQNPSISNATSVNSGNYFVAITVNGCTSDAVFTVVTVNPSITGFIATNNGPLCTGQTLGLSATPIAGASYLWNGPNGFTSTAQSPSINNASTLTAGVYTVQVNSAGCTASANTSVVINTTPAATIATNSGPVCAGGTLNLFASSVPGATYSWTGPNGFASAAQNPVVSNVGTINAGTYQVTTSANGCTSVAATTFAVVNALPTAPTASNNGPICAGNSLNLAASTVAGATYSWTGPNGFTSTQQNPIIANATAAASGTYSVSVTVNGCTSTFGVTAATVNPIPASPTANNNGPICAGATLNLTASTVAGATYSWTGPNGYTANTQNPSIPGATTLSSGSYQVVAVVAGCSSAPAATVAVVNATPGTLLATNSGPICQGQNLFLNVNPVAGATYSWTGPNGFTSNAQSPVIIGATAAATGAYSVTATLNGCTSAVSTTTAIVNAIPATPTITTNSPVCSGATINLNAPFVAGAVYVWSGPNGFSSTAQSPSVTNASTANAGTYSLVMLVNGCASAQATATVVVNAIPAAPTFSSNTPLCAGANLSLTATPVAGATYNWTGPNGFTSNAQNPVITAATVAASGVYSLSVTVNGCTSTTTNNTVVVNPAATAPTLTSNSPVCSGGTIFLGATTIVGATYNWTGPAGFATTAQNPVIFNVTTANSGVYSVVITNANGCASTVATVNVTVNATPNGITAGNNGPICTGATLNLTATTIAGATYAWTGPAGFTSANQNPTVTAPVSGTYSVVATVNGCASTPVTTTVVVNSIPATPSVANNGPLCAGQNLGLTASLVSGATYNWTGPAGFSSNAVAPVITSATAANSGVYSLTINVNGCTSAVATTAVTVTNTPATPTATNNGPVCQGAPISLSTPAVAGATYSWTGPNGFASSAQNPVIAIANPANAGTYNVVVTVAGCASAAGATNVTVTAVPSAPIVTNNGPLCEGQALNFNAQTIAGATYSWIGPNGFTSTLQNPSITSATTVNAGTYFLTATVSGCAVPVASTTVVVNAVPSTPVVGNNGPLCSGQTLVLSASLVGTGVTYNWVGPNGFTSTLQNPILANASTLNAGTYFLVVSKGGCETPVVQTTVGITQTPATPTIGSNSPVCAGSTLVLSAAPVAGASYSWNGPSGFTSTAQNPNIPTITSANAGVYSLTVTRNGCTSDVATITVNVLPIPATPAITTNSPICTGKTISLSTPFVANASYNWSGPANFSSTVFNPTINNATTANAGIYSLTITVNGCTSSIATANVEINVTPTAPQVFNTGPYCEGGFVELFASTISGASYNWTGPAGFTSSDQTALIFFATPANGGVYSLTATVNGCVSNVVTTTVDVIPTPPTPVVSHSTPVCEGGNLQFFAENIPGASFTWFGPNFNSFDQNPVLLNVTSANSGVYSVSALVGGCVSSFATILVTVNPIPAAPEVSNSSPVCLGGTLSLTASDIQGAVYSWTGPNGYVSTNQSPIITNVTTANAGTYNVTATVKGCASPAASTTVNLFPQSTATLTGTPQSICLNQSVKYNVVLTGTAPWTLSYSENGGPAQTVSGITASPYTLTVTPTAAGERTFTLVSLVDGNNCTSTNVSGSALASVTQNVNASALISGIASPICIGNTATFSVALTGSAPWSIKYTENGGIPITVSGITASPYTLTVTPAGFGVQTFTITQVIDATGCAGATVGGTATVQVSPNTTATAVISGNQPNVCAASTATFTVQLTGNAPWSIQYSDNGNAPVTVNGITASPYTLTVTPSGSGNRTITLTEVKDATGCGTGAVSGSATMFVTPATPIIASISGSASVCAGQSATLSVALTGTSPWTIQYAVNNGSPITVSGITASPFNLVVTPPTATGTYTYTVVSVTSANSCVSTTLIGAGLVTVNVPPTVELVTATATDCGANGSLTVQAVGGSAPYAYSIDGVNFENTSGTFTGLAAGGYLVYARGAGCVSAPISVVINGPQTPVITSATPAANSPSNSIVVTWQPVGGAASYTLRYRRAGTTTFTVVGNITTTSSTVTGLLSNETYEFSVQAVCPGGTLSAFSALLSATTQGSTGGTTTCDTPTGLAVNVQNATTATVTWNGNVQGGVCYIVSVGPLSANPNVWPQFLVPHPGNSLTITTLLAGTEYGARIRTNCSLCSSVSGIRSAFSNTLVFNTPGGNKEGITELAQNNATDISIYPNPNRGAFSLRFDAADAGEVNVSIFDASGRSVYQNVHSASAGMNELPIDLTQQAAGLYTLQFRQGTVLRSVKVIVQ